MIQKIKTLLFITVLFFPTVAYAASVVLPIRAVILNLAQLPASQAFAECDRLSLACRGSCNVASPHELVIACGTYELCCDMADMNTSFDEPLESTGTLESTNIDGFQVTQ